MESQNNTINLNPFIFPSETNLRFYLLIGLIVLSFVNVSYILVGGTLFKWAYWPAFLVALGATLLVFRWSLSLAKKDAQRRIREQSLQPFPPPAEDNPMKQASLQQMDSYIHQVIEQMPTIKALNPVVMWDESSEEPTGVAFGFGACKFICVRRGLHNAMCN